jgi:hypothetical protein
MYDQDIFAEMATTKIDSLLLTLFDFQSNAHRTYTLTEENTEEIPYNRKSRPYMTALLTTHV